MRTVRSTLLIVAAIAAGLCDMSAQGAPAKLTVSSTAFKNGEAIPAEYTADGRNQSPPLAWTARSRVMRRGSIRMVVRRRQRP